MIQTQQQNSIKNWVFGVEYKNKKDEINEFQLNEEKNWTHIRKWGNLIAKVSKTKKQSMYCNPHIVKFVKHMEF